MVIDRLERANLLYDDLNQYIRDMLVELAELAELGHNSGLAATLKQAAATVLVSQTSEPNQTSEPTEMLGRLSIQ